MPSVALADVSLAFGDRSLLDGVSLTLSGNQKTALSGANGSGKTTLMRILAGQIKPDIGQVIREKETSISYLPQTALGRDSGESASTVWETVAHAFDAEAEQQRLVTELEHRLSEHSEDSPAAQRLLDSYHVAQEKLQSGDYYRRREIIERVLQGLGFDQQQFDRPVAQFSEGWQMRIALARILCERADILLLDEPTNYLDLEARTWLEGFIQDFPGTVLVVSHDRFFLDTTVQGVVEIFQAQVHSYPGSFSAYERRREVELAQITQAYIRQQEEIERLELFIRRFRYNASKARQVQSRVKQLERMELIAPPPTMRHIHFSFPDPPHSGKLSLTLEGLSKSYNGQTVFQGLDLQLARGEKLVLVGINGAGKSTLMRIMAGREEPDQGKIRYGSGVACGYFSADHLEMEQDGGSVLEAAESWAPTELIPHLRNLLGAFLFHGDDIHKAVQVLSGGERSRLLVLRLLLRPSNMLFMDEPTNHLDLVSKDVLLDALNRYTGTLVFVSHDRYFIEKLATRVLEIEHGRPTLFYGDYPYYLWRKEQDLSPAPVAVPKPAARVLNRDEQKMLKTRLRRLEREEAQTMAELEQLQQESAELQQALSREEVYRDGEKVKQITVRLKANEERQHLLSTRWEQLEQERGDLD